MEVVKLKNGTEEAMPIVKVTMMILTSLFNEDPIGAYEAVMKARDPNHKIWGGESQIQKLAGLLGPDGSMHNSVRNVIVSAVEGEELDMALTSPIKSTAPQPPRNG